MKSERFRFVKSYKLLFICSVWIVACGKMERENNTTITTSLLETLDSVVVSFEGKLTVHDLDPLSGTVLFITQEQQPSILLADFDGEVRASFPMKQVLPDAFGSLVAPLKIAGEDSILAYGSKGFLTFDFSGKLTSRRGHLKNTLPAVPKQSMGEGMEKLDNRYLFINRGFGNIDRRSTKLNREMRLLEWLYPGTGESEPFVQLPETSIFRKGGSFFKDDWKPVFTIVDDLIFVAFGTEPVLYVYETSPTYSMVSSIPIALPEFRHAPRTENRPSRLDYFEMPSTSGKVLNIKRLNGYFIIAYFPGFGLANSKYADTGSTQELASIYREMHKNHPPRIAVVDSQGNAIADFVPERLDPESMVHRNGELWMQEKPDEETEQDYFRLFRVGLKFD